MRKASIVKCRRGSALLWAMLVLAVLSILVTAALTLGFSYHARSVVSNAQRQAYFSARSSAHALAVDIVNGNESLLPQTVGSQVAVSSIQYAEDVYMGECSAVIIRINDAKIQIVATAKVGNATESVAVDLVQSYTEIRTFTGGALLLGHSDAFSRVDGDLFYNGSEKLVISYPVSGSLFAPNAAVEVLSGGSVSGTILAQSCIYRATTIIPEVIVVENASLSTPVPADVKIVEVRSVKSLITASDPDLKVPDSFYQMPDGFDTANFAADKTPVIVPVESENDDLGAITALPDTMTYCVVPNTVNLKSMTFVGGGTVFVNVEKNITLSSKNINIESGTIVYFLLADGATFAHEETHTNSEYIVYGTASSTYQVKNKAEMVGEIVVGNLLVHGGTGLHYTTGSTTTGTEKTMLIPAGWQIAQYEDGST